MSDAAEPAPSVATASGPMLGAESPARPFTGLGVGASLALHAMFLALAGWVVLTPRGPTAERPISVEILTREQFDALTAPRAPVVAPIPAAPAPVPPEGAPPPAGEGMVRPTAMLSARALADPRSRAARELLPTLDDTERMIQLCGLEAMEQVQAWRETLQPTQVVAYATADVAVSGDVVDADGAAFRSGNAWYTLKFRCRLEPDHAAVAAFEFRVGALVPRNEWEARNLPADTATGTD
jgi:hypothetical protein